MRRQDVYISTIAKENKFCIHNNLWEPLSTPKYISDAAIVIIRSTIPKSKQPKIGISQHERYTDEHMENLLEDVMSSSVPDIDLKIHDYITLPGRKINFTVFKPIYSDRLVYINSKYVHLLARLFGVNADFVFSQKEVDRPITIKVGDKTVAYLCPFDSETATKWIKDKQS